MPAELLIIHGLHAFTVNRQCKSIEKQTNSNSGQASIVSSYTTERKVFPYAGSLTPLQNTENVMLVHNMAVIYHKNNLSRLIMGF